MTPESREQSVFAKVYAPGSFLSCSLHHTNFFGKLNEIARKEPISPTTSTGNTSDHLRARQKLCLKIRVSSDTVTNYIDTKVGLILNIYTHIIVH